MMNHFKYSGNVMIKKHIVFMLEALFNLLRSIV